MQYLRCKCGKYEFWGSGMNPATCCKCRRCGTVPATGPNNHPDPTPHKFDMVSEVETDEGKKTITRCSLCLRTKKQIEEEDRLVKNLPGDETKGVKE